MGIVINPDAPSPLMLAARAAASLEGALVELKVKEDAVKSTETSLQQAQDAVAKQKEIVATRTATFKQFAKEVL